MSKLLIAVGIILAMSNVAFARGIDETTDPKPTEANKCAEFHTVPNGLMRFNEFTFANGIIVRNLAIAEKILIQDKGIRIPSTGTRIDLAETAKLIWIKFLQVSAGDVYISTFIDKRYSEISPGGVDGKTYLITGEAIRGFSVQSEINEPRLVEICYIPS